MGADKRYKKAADAYEDAAAQYKTYMTNDYMQSIDRYSGQQGWNSAKQNAADYSKQVSQAAGEAARSNAYSAAKTAGYGKAASLANANHASNMAVQNTANQASQQGMSMAMQNNQASANNENAKLNAQQQVVNNAGTNYQNQADKSKTDYNQTMGTVSAVAGTVGSIFSAVSDERLKDITLDMDAYRWHTKNKFH